MRILMDLIIPQEEIIVETQQTTSLPAVVLAFAVAVIAVVLIIKVIKKKK